MASLNEVRIIGNVGNDPKISTINDGKMKVAQLSLATSRHYKNSSGDTVDETEWHSVVAYNNLAGVIEKYVKKGNQLYIGGRLRTRKWTDQSGTTHYITEIIAEGIQLLERKPVENGAQARPQQMQVSASVADEDPKDDLPF